jgi:hypothetical protein
VKAEKNEASLSPLSLVNIILLWCVFAVLSDMCVCVCLSACLCVSLHVILFAGILSVHKLGSRDSRCYTGQARTRTVFPRRDETNLAPTKPLLWHAYMYKRK